MGVESASPAVVYSHSVEPSSTVPPVVDALFKERWAAWQARGRRHDLAVQRRIRLIALVVAIAAGLVALGLLIAGGSR
jgi:hypothetical protein